MTNLPFEKKPEWDLQTLLTGYGNVSAEHNVAVSGMTMDSRAVEAGDLFVAVSGTGRHGFGFASSAVKKGAVAVIYEPAEGLEIPQLDVPAVAVEHLSRCAGDLANRFYFNPSEHLAVIGITGTNGKTSVSHYLAQALSASKLSCGVLGTLGTGFVESLTETGYTTPDAVATHRSIADLLGQDARAIAMEVSSHALVQHRVNGVHFDVAVFTNLSRDHLDYHGDMETYGEAKRLLIEMPGLKTAVINLDDPVGKEWLTRMPDGVELIPFSANGVTFEGDVLCAQNVTCESTGVTFDLSWRGDSLLVSVPVIGAFNVENLLATAGAMLALGHPLKQVAEAISLVRAVPGRMQTMKAEGSPLAVVDFAHTPDALGKALSAMRQHCTGTLMCVFGCGGDRDAGKRPKMAAIAEHVADVVIVTDDNPRGESPEHIVNEILTGFVVPASVRIIHDRRQAIECALEECGPGDALLIAGKGHENYQIVGAEKIEFSDRQVVAEYFRGEQ